MIIRRKCQNAPDGWHCTRNDGHDGPCAAWPDSSKLESEREKGMRYGYREGIKTGFLLGAIFGAIVCAVFVWLEM